MLRKTLPILPTLATFLTSVLFAGSTAASQESGRLVVDVFEAEQEGYHTYRIPSLVTAADGSLITIVEGRRDRAHDPGGGHIDLVYKRSVDAGETWSPLMLLDESEEGWGASNPVTLLDRNNARLWVFFCRWMPDRGGRNAQPGERHNQLWARYSDNHGATWSDAIDLTGHARDVDHWGASVFGPGSGAQTQTGALVVPAYSSEPGGEPGQTRGRTRVFRSDDGWETWLKSHAFVLRSEDGGETWERSPLIAAETSEPQVVQLASGELLLDARQVQSDHRWQALSGDDGLSWTELRPGVEVTPIATGLAVWKPQQTGEERVLWTGPRGPGRNDLVLQVSRDGGRTFTEQHLIQEGRAAYSDMTIMDDGRVGLVFERGQREGVPGGTVPNAIAFTVLDAGQISEESASEEEIRRRSTVERYIVPRECDIGWIGAHVRLGTLRINGCCSNYK